MDDKPMSQVPFSYTDLHKVTLSVAQKGKGGGGGGEDMSLKMALQ